MPIFSPLYSVVHAVDTGIPDCNRPVLHDDYQIPDGYLVRTNPLRDQRLERQLLAVSCLNALLFSLTTNEHEADAEPLATWTSADAPSRMGSHHCAKIHP